MAEQSSVHSYLNWAKQRIDEMDATLASLEAKAGQVQADSKVQANQLIAELKKQRDEFQANVKKQAQASEVAWQTNKVQLDSQWKAFEAQVRTYIDTVAKQVPQQQALFRDVAAAQVKTWREAAGAIQDVSDKIRGGAARRRRRCRDKDEGGRRRGGSAVAKIESGGNGVLGGAERGLGGIAQDFRPRQSGRVGCSQACRSSFGRLRGLARKPSSRRSYRF